MPAEFDMLMISATSIAVLHTLAGPDHYLPFVVLSKSRNWTAGKTLLWTLVCGLGHVGSSVLLGLGGAALGWSLSKVSWLEGVRGGLAAWLLLVFGIVYGTWGLWRAKMNIAHKHFDRQGNGEMYVYEHKHGQAVMSSERHKVTPWVMFIIFLLGPCEPMIPLLYVPAAQSSWETMGWLIVVYTVCTLTVMITLVLLGFYGITFLKTEALEKYIHALGGFTLAVCGAGMIGLGW